MADVETPSVESAWVDGAQTALEISKSLEASARQCVEALAQGEVCFVCEGKKEGCWLCSLKTTVQTIDMIRGGTAATPAVLGKVRIRTEEFKKRYVIEGSLLGFFQLMSALSSLAKSDAAEVEFSYDDNGQTPYTVILQVK